MPVKTKASPDEKIRIVQMCESGELSQASAAKMVGVSQAAVNQWVCLFRERGSLAFKEIERFQSYSPELKKQAVQDYLSGKGSQMVIAAKYGLRSKHQLQQWIKMYNEGRNFGSKKYTRTTLPKDTEGSVMIWNDIMISL